MVTTDSSAEEAKSMASSKEAAPGVVPETSVISLCPSPSCSGSGSSAVPDSAVGSHAQVSPVLEAGIQSCAENAASEDGSNPAFNLSFASSGDGGEREDRRAELGKFGSSKEDRRLGGMGGVQVPRRSMPRSERPPQRVKVIPRRERRERTVYLTEAFSEVHTGRAMRIMIGRMALGKCWGAS